MRYAASRQRPDPHLSPLRDRSETAAKVARGAYASRTDAPGWSTATMVRASLAAATCSETPGLA
jgi:hypothetical protein